MGTIKGSTALQAQLWVIHMAMKWAFEKQIPMVVVETSDNGAYQVFRNRDDEEEFIEEEDLELILDQIDILRARYNKSDGDGSQSRSCTISPVAGTRNEPTRRMALLGMETCEGIVDIPVPPPEITEFLDLDNGLGPLWEVFEILPNRGLGEIITRDIVDPTIHNARVKVKMESLFKEEEYKGFRVRENSSLRNNKSSEFLSNMSGRTVRGIVIREAVQNLTHLSGSDFHRDTNDKGKRKMVEEPDIPPGFEYYPSTKRISNGGEDTSQEW
ncbi:hypothetical protein DCAR_0102055 [Daucus carota subsp. sativus]|uniref:Uncharacterized protein n=1 Tax=Daucus carota subsp. sativus TaxID=79200 RepID=A0A166GUI7_DAUCS|nr:hypothetical protein DCAR_0102055 [Daucus carota subsp. sativus]